MKLCLLSSGRRFPHIERTLIFNGHQGKRGEKGEVGRREGGEGGREGGREGGEGRKEGGRGGVIRYKSHAKHMHIRIIILYMCTYKIHCNSVHTSLKNNFYTKNGTCIRTYIHIYVHIRAYQATLLTCTSCGSRWLVPMSGGTSYSAANCFSSVHWCLE